MFKNKSENCLHFLSSHPRLFYPPDREFSTSCCINRHRRSAKTKPTHRPFGRTNFACSSNDLPSPCWIFRTSRKRYESERETEVSNFRNAARMFFRAKIPPSQKGWKMAFSWSGKVSFLLGFRLKHPHTWNVPEVKIAKIFQLLSFFSLILQRCEKIPIFGENTFDDIKIIDCQRTLVSQQTLMPTIYEVNLQWNRIICHTQKKPVSHKIT